VGDDRVRGFYPSLYLNLGRSHEVLGHPAEASRYYELAAEGLDVVPAGLARRNVVFFIRLASSQYRGILKIGFSESAENTAYFDMYFLLIQLVELMMVGGGFYSPSRGKAGIT
jgi:hypothetical protein